MKRYCYDCGRKRFTYFVGHHNPVCDVCGEIVYPHERIGLIRALIRRLLFPWHSNTQDPVARGWRTR